MVKSLDITSKHSEGFGEILAKAPCPGCKTEVIFRFFPNQVNLDRKDSGDEISLPDNLQLRCKKCGEIIPTTSLISFNFIERPVFLRQILYLPEYFLDSHPINDVQRQWGIQKVATIFHFSINQINPANHNYRQLIHLLGYCKTHPRLQKFANRLSGAFSNHITSKYTPEYNFILTGISMFNGIVGMDDVQIINLISTSNPKSISKENQTSILNRIKFICKNLFWLNQTLSYNLFHEIGVSKIDLYNFMEKYNDLYKILFGFSIVPTQKHQLMEIYAKMRHAFAHSNIIIHEGKAVLVDINAKKQIIGTIGTVKDITDEMIIVCVIISQVTGLYQLLYQTKNK
ncbi:hypothetical protein [Candidatus Lokiarchaeum ossiferum]|uniref:hypothetical protein n=1 Tax=Candidatus Lokiarchaeum ossiferum TaxID=2951803 RepID=UPI00352F35CA